MVEWRISIGNNTYVPGLKHRIPGIRLVNSLTEQIDGKIELDRTNGTRFIITFKDREYI